MMEIATQASQLQCHNSIIEIETDKKKKEAAQRERAREEQQQKRWEEENQLDQLLEDQVLDKEESIRKALIQNVYDECEEKGFALPPSVMRLLNHFKSKLKNSVFQ